MQLRILIASDFYPPFIGGAERQVRLLGRELSLQGHQVSIATVWHKDQPSQSQDGPVQVHRLKGLSTSLSWFSKDPNRRFHPPCPDPGIVLGLRKLIKEIQPDLIHANGWIAYSCAAALIGKSIPLIVSVRDYGYSCATRTMLNQQQLCSGPQLSKCLNCATQNYKSRPKGWAAVTGILTGRTLLRRKMSVTHSVSTFVQQIVRRDLLSTPAACSLSKDYTIPDIVIPSFLAESEEPQADEAHKIQSFIEQLPAEPFILFVGALQPHKGLTPLLAAYRELESPPPLVLIGSVWKDTPRDFGPGVTVLGNVPHAAVMSAWERCMFGVAPSVWPDPLPGVVREAMLKGKAMIATATGGNLDMIKDGETGLLVPPGEVAPLKEAMEKLWHSQQLREQLGTLAQERAQTYTASAVVPRFENLYGQLVKGHPVETH